MPSTYYYRREAVDKSLSVAPYLRRGKTKRLREGKLCLEVMGEGNEAQFSVTVIGRIETLTNDCFIRELKNDKSEA